jgi:hypothetical protein
MESATHWGWLGSGGKRDNRARGPFANPPREQLQVKAPAPQGPGSMLWKPGLFVSLPPTSLGGVSGGRSGT